MRGKKAKFIRSKVKEVLKKDPKEVEYNPIKYSTRYYDKISVKVPNTITRTKECGRSVYQSFKDKVKRA